MIVDDFRTVNFLRSVTAVATRTSILRSIDWPIRYTVEGFTLYAVSFLTFCPQSRFLGCTFLCTATSLSVLCATPFSLSTLFRPGNLLPLVEDIFSAVVDCLCLAECFFGGFLGCDALFHSWSGITGLTLFWFTFLCLGKGFLCGIEVGFGLIHIVGHNFGGNLFVTWQLHDSIPRCISIGLDVVRLSLFVERDIRKSGLLRLHRGRFIRIGNGFRGIFTNFPGIFGRFLDIGNGFGDFGNSNGLAIVGVKHLFELVRSIAADTLTVDGFFGVDLNRAVLVEFSGDTTTHRHTGLIDDSKLIIEGKLRAQCFGFGCLLLGADGGAFLLEVVQSFKIGRVGKGLELLFGKCRLLTVGELHHHLTIDRHTAFFIDERTEDSNLNNTAAVVDFHNVSRIESKCAVHRVGCSLCRLLADIVDGNSLFHFGVYGFTGRHNRLRIGKFHFACHSVTNHNRLIGSLTVDCSVGIDSEWATDNVHLTVIETHNGRLYHAGLAIDTTVNHGIALCNLLVNIIIDTLQNAVAHGLGVDIVAGGVDFFLRIEAGLRHIHKSGNRISVKRFKYTWIKHTLYSLTLILKHILCIVHLLWRWSLVAIYIWLTEFTVNFHFDRCRHFGPFLIFYTTTLRHSTEIETTEIKAALHIAQDCGTLFIWKIGVIDHAFSECSHIIVGSAVDNLTDRLPTFRSEDFSGFAVGFVHLMFHASISDAG